MMARRESCMVLSESERTVEILFATVELRINDNSNFSILGSVSDDWVIIFLLSLSIYAHKL